MLLLCFCSLSYLVGVIEQFKSYSLDKLISAGQGINESLKEQFEVFFVNVVYKINFLMQ